MTNLTDLLAGVLAAGVVPDVAVEVVEAALVEPVDLPALLVVVGSLFDPPGLTGESHEAVAAIHALHAAWRALAPVEPAAG